MISNFMSLFSEYPIQVLGIIVFFPMLLVMIYENRYNKKNNLEDKVNKYFGAEKDEKFINRVVRKTDYYLGEKGDKIKLKLEQANVLFTKKEFISLMLLGIAIGALIGFIIFPFAGLFKGMVGFIHVPILQIFMARILAAIVFGFVGYFTPHVWVQYLIMDRRKLMDAQIEDALLQLAESLRSGASINLAIKLAGDELKYPMKDEFARLYQELGTGKSFNDAMEDLKNRVNLEDFTFAMSAVQIQSETGASLEPLLREIVKTVADRRVLKKEMQKQIVSSKTQAIFLLIAPILFIIAFGGMSPETYGQMLKVPVGIVMVVLGVIAYIIAALITIKIVRDVSKLT